MLLGLLAVEEGIVLIVLLQHKIHNDTVKFLGIVLALIDHDLLGEAVAQKLELVPS